MRCHGNHNNMGTANSRRASSGEPERQGQKMKPSADEL